MRYESEEHYRAVLAQSVKKFKGLFPEVKARSGIYVFERTQIVGKTEVKYGYVGQAKNLIERITSHLISHKGHIDNSIAKRGVKWKNNGEWGFFVECSAPHKDLDQLEKDIVEKYMGLGWQLPYNKTLGGQAGKTGVADTERKGYLQGKRDGRSKLMQELKQYFSLEALPAAFKNDGGLRAAAKTLLEEYERREINKKKT